MFFILKIDFFFLVSIEFEIYSVHFMIIALYHYIKKLLIFALCR